ncbi:MAG: hypothetical protein ACYST5_20325, partial [Planctomycetota bacterium]
KLIENAVVGAAQINSKNQNGRKINNNKNKTKSETHNLLLNFPLLKQHRVCHPIVLRYMARAQTISDN